MFSLIGLGVSSAYGYSVGATCCPSWIPVDFKQGGVPAVYFEAAAMIVVLVLVLLGQLLELRAPQDRDRPSRAVSANTSNRAPFSRWHLPASQFVVNYNQRPAAGFTW